MEMGGCKCKIYDYKICFYVYLSFLKLNYLSSF